MICFDEDGGRAIAKDADGLPLMEIYSIEAFQQIGPADYAVTAFRGRFGTSKRTFSYHTSECWIILVSVLFAVFITPFVLAAFFPEKPLFYAYAEKTRGL